MDKDAEYYKNYIEGDESAIGRLMESLFFRPFIYKLIDTQTNIPFYISTVMNIGE